jgi:rhodanese-related sulfurtransferase
MSFWSLFKKNPKYTQIAKFQVWSLLSQRVQFEVIRLEPISEELKSILVGDPMLAQLVTMSREELNAELVVTDFKTSSFRSKDTPVLLLCNTGKKSAKMAAKVAKLGYKNLYTVAQGFKELAE